ncbi:MAG: hypothetical protein K5695_02500 [Oscillospiraceae bacterium]|nr:hypothetical protein [Oscillospiraceae bacterium]
MKKKLLCLLLPLFMLLPLLCPFTVQAAAAKAVIYDESGRLGKDYDACLSRLQKAAKKTNMNVAVIIGTEGRTDITIESIAVNSYDELFGKNTDGLLYYMDLKGSAPYDYITTSGMANFFYTNSDQDDRINAMFDALDPYLYPVGSEDVPGAIGKFAEEVEYYFDAGIPEHYYYYDDETRLYYTMGSDGNVVTSSGKPYRDTSVMLMITFMFTVVGLFVALIIFFAVKSRYKFKYSISPTNYVNRKNVEFYSQYDNFVHTHTSKVPLNSDSGSGHRSGGSHHSGGHSHGGHGGGGHHR